MSGNYMDKLLSDIQHYLREEQQQITPESQDDSSAEDMTQNESPVAPRGRKSAQKNILIGTITLLSACAIGSITVAIMLLGLLGVPGGMPGGPHEAPVSTIWLFAAGGCGIFFSAMLISSWRRLAILARIEKNTRLILESKQTANVLFEDYMRKFD
jgi:hypothetical protein